MNCRQRHFQKVTQALRFFNTTFRVFFGASYLSAMKNFMRKLLFIPALIICSNLFSQTLQQIESKKVDLPNGWSLTPIGKSLPLGDLPLNMAVSPSKKIIAVTNNGQSVQSLQLIDVVNDKVLSSVVIPKSWYGIKFSSDEKSLYASGGNDNWILKYAINTMLVKPGLRDTTKKGPLHPTQTYSAIETKLKLVDSIK